jgi:phosphoenolpyruvate carboxykinase (ATP)
MYYFLSGYTSKVAGTEKGLGVEPQATFSTCFGAPFLPLKPHIYADLLGERIARHNAQVWLVNTGWTGGPYGVGERIHLPYTRAMVRAVLTHQLDDMPFQPEEYFGLWVPDHCPGVPDDILRPEKTWQDKNAYRTAAANLVSSFQRNFTQFASEVTPLVAASGPQLVS